MFCLKEEGLGLPQCSYPAEKLVKRNTERVWLTDLPPACWWWSGTRWSPPCWAWAGSPLCDLSDAGRLVSWPADPCKSHGPVSPSRSHPQPRNELLSFVVIFITGSRHYFHNVWSSRPKLPWTFQFSCFIKCHIVQCVIEIGFLQLTHCSSLLRHKPYLQ